MAKPRFIHLRVHSEYSLLEGALPLKTLIKRGQAKAGPSGALTATNGGQSWTGTWSSGYDDSKNKFLINFDGARPIALSELQEDWLILKMEDKLMHFEHTSGGNGDTDVVKFERS